MLESNRIKELLLRYINNQTSPEEQEEIELILLTPTGKLALEELLNEEAINLFKTRDSIDPAISKEILGKINRTISRSVIRRKGQFFSAIKVAASIILILGLVFITYRTLLPEVTIISTGPAQRRSIELPDKSIIVLNANSTIKYNTIWEERKIREVYLKGEAFFDVKKNWKRPFIVYTPEIAIKVLGTSFNVKAYNDDLKVEATLVTGKIYIQNLLGPKNNNAIMVPNQKATYQKNSNKLVLNHVNTERYTSWRRGKLIFEDNTFEDIIVDLERWYGVDIRFQNSRASKCRYSLKIEKESLREVLDLFKKTSGLHYSIKGKEVEVWGKLCS